MRALFLFSLHGRCFCTDGLSSLAFNLDFFLGPLHTHLTFITQL